MCPKQTRLEEVMSVKTWKYERRQRKPGCWDMTASKWAILFSFLTSVLFPLRYMKVNREQITAARRSDLFDFLRQTYPDKFIRTPRNLFLKENQSLVIHIGYSGYRDYATVETGNSIDFLTRYLGYSFQEAVIALADTSSCKSTPVATNAIPYISTDKVKLPFPAPLPHPSPS